MSIFKIILIALLFLIFVYLIQKILFLKNLKENQIDFTDAKMKDNVITPEILEKHTIQEGITNIFGTSMNSEFSSVSKSKVISNIVNASNTDLTLKQYCIKASYNSALTGYYVNLDMIKYVLSRGCRFLDFEVYSFDNIPYVAYSTDHTFSSVNTLNKITLQEVFNTLITYAFMAPSPNPRDPLFIHLRIKTTNNDLYSKIASIVDHILKPKLYKGIINTNTLLSDIMGSIVLIVDKKVSPTYKNSSPCGANCSTISDTITMNNGCPTCFSLSNYVNVESGSTFLRIYNYSYLMDQTYTSPEVEDDNINTNVTSLKIVIPDMGASLMGSVRNPSYYSLPSNYGVQIVAYPFYKNDIYLDQYESAFANTQTAFVPLSSMLDYVNKIINSYQA